jgi:CHAD domain-containing protein
MNSQQFFELAKQVRAAQKDYFSLQCDFVTVKKLENQFDKALQEGLDDAQNSKALVFTTEEYQARQDLIEQYREPMINFDKPKLDYCGDTPT